MTERERIVTLLEHYRDVLDGLDEHGADSVHVKGDWADVLALMCSAWNAPAYRELERLLVVMRERWPKLYQAIRARFLDYADVRQAYCKGTRRDNGKRCGWHPSTEIGRVHGGCLHRGRTVTLEARMRRVRPVYDAIALGDALEWLERHWRRSVGKNLPPEVIQIETEQMKRAAA